MFDSELNTVMVDPDAVEKFRFFTFIYSAIIEEPTAVENDRF